MLGRMPAGERRNQAIRMVAASVGLAALLGGAAWVAADRGAVRRLEASVRSARVEASRYAYALRRAEVLDEASHERWREAAALAALRPELGEPPLPSAPGPRTRAPTPPRARAGSRNAPLRNELDELERRIQHGAWVEQHLSAMERDVKALEAWLAVARAPPAGSGSATP
jgi:hypothetical protein